MNGLGGQRLREQKKELNELKNYLSANKFSEVDIRLNFDSNLMHTKLYYIENESRSVWFIGSANATNAAFNKNTGNKNNEELLISSDTDKRAIKSYISNLKSNSISTDDAEHSWPEINDLISFFRSGTIFFKSNINISFTFSELKIPEEIEEKLIKIAERPLYTSPGKAWGPYNLRMALGLSDDLNLDDNSKVSVKPYSIETCYGLWVPVAYLAEFEFKIKEKSKISKRKLLELRDKMIEYGDQKLLGDFDGYMISVRQKLKSAEIESNKFDFNEDELRKKFLTFVKRLREKISDEHSLNKLADKFIRAGMPEIWDDEISSREFQESFFDYIAGNFGSNQNTPMVVKSIIEFASIKTSSGLDGDDIKKSFQDLLRQNAWADDNWVKRMPSSKLKYIPKKLTK